MRGELTSPGQLRFANGNPVTTPGGQQIHSLILQVGDLQAGERRTFNIPARVDTNFNSQRSNGWTHVKLLVFDETGSRQRPNHQVHLDHPLDTKGPSYIELSNSTNLVKPGAATFRGVVIDDSPVPTLLVEVGGSQTTCSDSTPADTSFRCDLTIPDGADGQSLTTRMKAIDLHGQESQWFDGPTLTLDRSAPVVTASGVLSGTLGNGPIGPDETALVGTLSDNRFAHKVVVCEGDSCGDANVLLDPTTVPTTSYVYRDEPEESLVVGSDHTCPDKLARSFDVSDSFTIADLDVGLIMGHDNRNDAVVWLTSPAGTRKELVSRGANVSNLNVLLDDAASLSVYVDDDQSDHMISPPFFSNVRRPHSHQLADFRGENAQGTWLLELCDNYDDEDDGLYYRSELRFTAQAVYTGTVGSWQHTLNLPANQEAITKTYSVYGVDQAGNQSEPVTFSVNIDTKSPELSVETITPLLSPTRSYTSLTWPVTLAGIVNDVNLNVMRLIARTPNGQFIRDRIPVSGQTWQYTDETTFNRDGLYCIWIEAEDEANNLQTSAAYALQVTIGETTSSDSEETDSSPTSQELTIGQSQNNGQYRLFLPLVGLSHDNDVQSVYRYFVDPAVCR